MLKDIKNDFPIFNSHKDLIYFDTAATSQKPSTVIDAEKKYYEEFNANVHRGVYSISENATAAFEDTRAKIAEFIGGVKPEEVIFTKGTTESINLVVSTWGEENIKEGDEIIVSELDHHSNLVPWQQLSKRKKAVLKIVPIKPDFILDLEKFKEMSSEKTKIVSLSHVSNTLGTVVPVDEIIKSAKEVGAKILLDGAQAIPHLQVNVKYLDVDFYVFSAHKALGPTGVGVLYAKKEILEVMPPYQFGGSMISEVSEEESEWSELPWKFEAGTPNIAGVITFAKSLEYLQNIGLEKIKQHELELVDYFLEKSKEIQELKVYLPKDKNLRTGTFLFSFADIHPHDLSSLLNEKGIAIRSGHHCAKLVMNCLNTPAAARLSFYLYNTKEEIDKLIEALKEIKNNWNK
ncbi:MAG: SufS family cysteine desulfurase [bacterium]